MEKLNTTKGQSEAVIRERTDNTMAKVKKTNTDLLNTTHKTYD